MQYTVHLLICTNLRISSVPVIAMQLQSHEYIIKIANIYNSIIIFNIHNGDIVSQSPTAYRTGIITLWDCFLNTDFILLTVSPIG